MASRNPSPEGSPDPLRELLDEKSLADEITKAIEGNDCPRDKELQAFLRKELDEPERIEVKSHLTFCSRCQSRAGQMDTDPNPQVALREPEKDLRGLKLPPAPKAMRKSRRLILAAGAAGAVLLAVVYLVVLRSLGDFPYAVKIVHADSAPKGERLFYVVRTPNPIYLIEISIEGDGRISSKIPPCGMDGVVSDLEQIPLMPRVSGVLDLYLVPCPTSEGFPNRLLSELLKFIRTESSIDRENQRRGIEMALGYYHLKFLHEIYLFKA